MDLLLDPLRNGITQRALIDLLILGVVCGPLGVWVVLFRQSYSAESMARLMAWRSLRARSPPGAPTCASSMLKPM